MKLRCYTSRPSGRPGASVWLPSFVFRMGSGVAVLLLAPGCTTSSTTPAGPPRPAAPPAASAQSVAPRELECPKNVPGPFAPLSRNFHRIALSTGAAFEQLVGWDNRAWLLSGERLFVHDGNSLVSQVQLCPGAVPTGDRSYFLEVGSYGLFAIGVNAREDFILARVAKDGSVSCETWPRLPAGHLQLTLALWPERNVIQLPRDTRPYLGLSIPPPKAGWGVGWFFATSRNSAWLQIPKFQDGRRWTSHFDGNRWVLASDVPFGIANDMWEDPTGVTWAIPERGPVFGLSPGWVRPTCLAKNHGKTWSLVSVPGDNWFQPHWLTGTAADDMWFVGRSVVLQWDGSQWRVESFQPPVDRPTPVGASFVGRPFMDQSGSLWLLGTDHSDGKQKLFRTDPKPPTAVRGRPPG